MTDSESTYIQLNDVNATDTIRPATFMYNGTEDLNANTMNCLKFRFNTQTFPVFVPKFANTTLLTIDNMTNKSSTAYRTTGFLMDWAIAVVNKLPDDSYEYSTQQVKWIPQKNFNKPATIPNRLGVLGNSYFYAYNSIHVLYIIEETIGQCLADLGLNKGVKMVKNAAGKYQILVDTTNGALDNIRILFNYDLSQAFNFYYKNDFLSNYVTNTQTYNEIVIDKYFTTKINNVSYYVAQILSLTTRLFPFSDIQIVSGNGISAEPIITNAITSGNVNNSKPIVFSYSLNVTDIDQPCDNFNYTAVTGFRKSVLLSQFVSFSLGINLVTYDGYSIQLMLDKNDNVDILLQFD